jgi:hypothetical protein
MDQDSDVSFSNDWDTLQATVLATAIGGEIYEICNLTICILLESITPTADVRSRV